MGSDTDPKVFTASAAPTVSSLMSVDGQCARLECPLDFHLIRTSDGPSSTQEGKWAARPQEKGPLMGPRLLACGVHGAPSRGRGANDPHATAAEARTPRGCPHSAQGRRPPLPTPEYTVPPSPGWQLCPTPSAECRLTPGHSPEWGGKSCTPKLGGIRVSMRLQDTERILETRRMEISRRASLPHEGTLACEPGDPAFIPCVMTERRAP